MKAVDNVSDPLWNLLLDTVSLGNDRKTALSAEVVGRIVYRFPSYLPRLQVCGSMLTMYDTDDN